jgi:hypothetical protein
MKLIKSYYVICGACGIITGKIKGFALARKVKNTHRDYHDYKKEEYHFVQIKDWGEVDSENKRAYK